MPLPTIAISEIGVFLTTSGPNSSSRPCVTAIEPPISAMSSPMMKTLSSSRSALPSASRTASRYVSSGIDVLERVFGRRIGSGLGELDRRLHLGGDLRVDGRMLVVRELEARSEQLDRVLRLALLLQSVLVAVDLRVADEVPRQPVRAQVEQHGPLPRDRVLAGGEGREIDGLDVLAVGLDELHPERRCPLAELVHGKRELLARRCRLGPAVVLEAEDRGHLPQLPEVQRLVEAPGVRRAVAEERDGHALLATHLEGESGSADGGQPASDDGVRTEVPDLDVVQVHRAA